MQNVLDYAVTALTPVLLVILVMAGQRLISSLRSSNNAVLHTIGEFVYHEIEDNFAGVPGQQKLIKAVQAARARLSKFPQFANLSDAEIVDVIQKAWFQNEGQYKILPAAPVVTPPVTPADPVQGDPAVDTGSTPTV